MTDPGSKSQVDLIRDRHRHLKRQRSIRFLQAIWRTTVTLSLAISLGWVVSQPEWKLREQSQITFEGNKQLSTASLEALLPFSFPLSLIRLQPRKIEATLQKHAHIRQVLVSRKLFPPRTTIFVEERPPVAMAVCNQCLLLTNPSDPAALTIGPANVWIFDEQGVALPAQNYPAFAQSENLPPLIMKNFLTPPTTEIPPKIKERAASQQAKLVALNREKQKQWRRMHQVLRESTVIKSDSPVKLASIDWQDLDNLRLQTKLANIHLGPYSKQFPQQLKALDEMRSLSNTVDTDQIIYIDLQNPDQPDLEMRNPSVPQTPPPR